MKSYFSGIIFYWLMSNQLAFSQAYMTTESSKSTPTTFAYPAIRISRELAEKIFLDTSQKVINCPLLFSNTWNYPSGSAIALCDDTKVACLRYGLLLKEIETAEGQYLEELQKTLILEKQEITIRLRGCELGIKRTLNGESIEEAAGYPTNSY